MSFFPICFKVDVTEGEPMSRDAARQQEAAALQNVNKAIKRLSEARLHVLQEGSSLLASPRSSLASSPRVSPASSPRVSPSASPRVSLATSGMSPRSCDQSAASIGWDAEFVVLMDILDERQDRDTHFRRALQDAAERRYTTAVTELYEMQRRRF